MRGGQNRLNLLGRQFTQLVVIASAKRINNHARWLCLCSCGKKREFDSTSLTKGAAKSCGCLSRRIQAASVTRHGHSKFGKTTRTYNSWRAMIRRCYGTTYTDFPQYGARGIKVCKRWLKFENFLADMGERPEGKSLDRWPNNKGDYKKSNCRWATPKEQAHNRRRPCLQCNHRQ